MSEEKKVEQAYTAQAIKVLEGLEGVRKRPAMYIGSTGVNGLHHLVYEVVDNSVDEALGGHCNTIDVVLFQDGSCSVQDNGRGIPVDIHESEGISAAEVVLTKLHAGGKFNKDSYKFSGGLHGVGVSVVNGLSKHLELVICRDGEKYQQFYSRGKPLAPLALIGTSSTSGTFVKFTPDEEIFTALEFNFDVLAARFREIAFLNKGLTINITSHITNQEQSFFFEGGIVSFIEHINKKKTVLFPTVFHVDKSDDTFVLDFAFQYNDTYSEQSYSFVNNIRTTEGGTHEAGLKSAFTKVFNKYAQAFGMIKDEALSSEDVREGLVSVLSIKVPEPQFEGQTKTKLGNTEIKGVVDSWVYSFLDSLFEENPSVAKIILQKAIQAQQARLAAKKARELSRKKNVFEYSVLPGKLADCSESDPAKTELFIVEGNSAGGSAKQARNRFTQAILPIRGKILNVEKTAIARALSNNEIKDLITAIGAGVGDNDFNIDKVRYHKIVIMTDADVDGSHIRTLLLTFFFRYMKPLIDKGFLYIAQPPLYKAKVGKAERYLKDEGELKRFIFDWAKNNLSFRIGNEDLPSDKSSNLIEALYSYEAELTKASNNLEMPLSLLHDIIKGLPNEETFNNLVDVVEALKRSLKETTVSIVSKNVDEFVQESILITKGKHNFTLSGNFFKSQEPAFLKNLFLKVRPYDADAILTLQNNKTKFLNAIGVLDLSDQIIKFGKTLLTLSRYKGLGEMDPEPLWETTMDPEKRSFLQVTIDDVIKADQTFTALMGEDVESRRAFIEEHAHFVKNCDIY